MTSMAFVLFLVAVSVLLVCRPIYAEINCENDVHTKCFSESLYMTQSEHEFLSDKFLTMYCSAILEDIDCKANYLLKCHREHHNFFLLLTNGVRGMFSELCNETSALREGYRQHVACFGNSSQHFRICVFSTLQSVQSAQENLIENSDDIFDEEQRKVKGMCLFQRLFRTCAFNAVRASCNDAAAMYLETLISKAIQDLVNEVC